VYGRGGGGEGVEGPRNETGSGEVGWGKFCQHLFILPISSTGYTLAVESSPAGPTALVPLGDPD
jgi:hypothetical protein